MDNCTTNTPFTQEYDPCDGCKKSTECIVYEAAIPALALPANSTATEVIQALIQTVQALDNRLKALE